VNLNIIIAGTADRQLEELLKAPNYRVRSVAVSELLALAQPNATQPDVLVLDVREALSLPPTLATLRRQHPTTGVVIVARRMDPTLMLEAMRAGVNEWLAEPLTAADLTNAIERVTSARPSQVNGQIFAFVGAKGGVGTTTTAVNVAAALAQVVPDEPTLLMDMHLSYGDAAVFLGAEPRFSVADAMENTHRLDEAFFESLVVQTKSKVHLLASAERAVGGADLRRISTLLQFALAHYRFTLLDVPRSEAATLDALEGVATILIVANQELATVRNAGRMAAALRQRYGKDRIRIIVSRFDKQAEIGPEDVARVAGSPVSFSVPSDYRAALQALNKGRPIAMEKDTKLAAAFNAIACELAGVRPQAAAEPSKASGGGLLGRITGRR
jgi:pilus assembly protein CpaE